MPTSGNITSMQVKATMWLSMHAPMSMFQDHGADQDGVEVCASWDTPFGMLLSVFILRESLRVLDHSWYPSSALTVVGDVCDWKRIHCDRSTNRIEKLELNHANISGTLPTEIAGFVHMKELYLFSNPGLYGPIPTELGSLANLTHIEIHRTSIDGTVPTELGQLKELQYLLMYDTNLYGQVPTEVCQLRRDHELAFLETTCSGPLECDCRSRCKQRNEKPIKPPSPILAAAPSRSPTHGCDSAT